jgi:hypothetical protein
MLIRDGRRRPLAGVSTMTASHVAGCREAASIPTLSGRCALKPDLVVVPTRRRI